MRNERTSKRVAKIAARILAAEPWDIVGLKWVDIKAIAASALTQTTDKKPRKRVGAKAALVKRLSKRGGWPRVAKRKRRARK